MESVSSVSQIAAPDFPLTPAGSAAARSTAGEQATMSRGSGKPGAQPSVDSVVKDLNDAVKMFNTNLSFSVDKETGKEVIKVIDASTKEVIRQIPPEDVLRIAAHMKELLGILYDDKR
jgi:flagellar protein FlaG